MFGRCQFALWSPWPGPEGAPGHVGTDNLKRCIKAPDRRHSPGRLPGTWPREWKRPDSNQSGSSPRRRVLELFVEIAVYSARATAGGHLPIERT